MKKKSLFLILLLFFVSSISAQTKIVVLSDIHVMAPELLVSDGPAWQQFLASDRKMVDQSKILFDTMIERLKTELQPQLLLITGDLTKDGELLSHQYVAAKLDELRQCGIQTLVIPGNHDLGTRNAFIYDGEKTTKAPTASAIDFTRLYMPYGYGESSDREGSTLTYCAEPIPGLVVIGIDSGQNGWLSKLTLNWICNKAKEARSAGKQVLAMMHHPLFPHFYGVDKFVKTAVITDYEQVRNRLADAGVRVILSGHFHTSDIAKSANADLSQSIYDITTGSKISYPMHHRWVTISENLSTMNIRTFATETIEDHPEVIDIAKERLTKCINRKLESKGVLFASSIACQATFLHCEGNENEANGVCLIDSIPYLAFVLYPEAWYALNSMLDDFSFFGEENQNRVNDLNLSIKLSEEEIPVPESIQTIATEPEEDRHLYNFMGQQADKSPRGFIIQGGRKILLR